MGLSQSDTFSNTRQDRLSYYLGPVAYKRFVVNRHSKYYGEPILVDNRILQATGDPKDPSYIEEMKGYWSLVPGKYLFIPGDVSHSSSTVPWLAKTRPINERGASVLLPFNIDRHWGPIREAKASDIPWNQKMDHLVWRGADTGQGKRVGVEKYSNVSWGDLGFVNVTHEKYKGHIQRQHIKPKMSIADQLKHKYILSIEGNDVATNLKWILSTGSVCIMPTPTIESWLMEGRLIPWKHYIPVRGDLSDLHSRVEWAKKHQRECIKIVHNANQFMSQFGKSDLELIKNILETYQKNVKIED